MKNEDMIQKLKDVLSFVHNSKFPVMELECKCGHTWKTQFHRKVLGGEIDPITKCSECGTECKIIDRDRILS